MRVDPIYGDGVSVDAAFQEFLNSLRGNEHEIDLRLLLDTAFKSGATWGQEHVELNERVKKLEAIRVAALDRMDIKNQLIWDALIGNSPTDARTKAFREHRIKTLHQLTASEDRLTALLQEVI